MEKNVISVDFPFLKGGGDMGEKTRAFNWHNTALSYPGNWPQSLRTTINVMLNSRLPMLLFWGPDQIQFYNDAFQVMAADNDMHLIGLGKPGIESWGLKWPALYCSIEEVLATGIAVETQSLASLVSDPASNDLGADELCFAPVFDESGNAGGVLMSSTSIQEPSSQRALLAVTDKLKSEESKFQSIIEQAPLAIGLLTGREMIVEVGNKMIFDFWGKDPSMTGKRLIEVLPELAGQPFMKLLEDVFDTGVTFFGNGIRATLEHKGKLEDLYFDLAYTPLRDARQTITGVMVLATNVTDREATSIQLRESEARFRSLVEEAPIATCLLVGKELKVEVANNMMLGFWGKNASVIGKPLKEGLPELQGQPFLDILDKVFTTGQAYEAKAQAAELIVDGRLGTFYFDYTYKPLRNAAGAVYAIMNIATDVTNQVTARQKIEENQRQILASFEESPVAIALIEKEQLSFTMANNFYADLVGRTPSDIIGRPLLEAMPELVGEDFDDDLRAVLTQGIPFTRNEVPVKIIRDEQLQTLFVNLTFQPRRDQDNNISAVLAVATDVTQQVLARQKVEASEAKLRSVIAAAPAAIAVFMGRELIVQYPNLPFIEIMGKPHSVEGLPLSKALPQLIDEEQPFLQVLDQVFTSGVMFQSLGALVKIVKDGILTEHYYNITFTPLFDSAGQVYAILDISIDVTEQVLAGKKLREAEMNLREAVEVAELATWSFDAATNNFHFSFRLQDWFGMAATSADASVFFDCIHARDRERVRQSMVSTLAPGSSGIYNEEYTVVNRVTNKTRILHGIGRSFMNEHGLPVRLAGITQDITNQRRTQLMLRQEVKERTEELATANLELKLANDELATTNANLLHSNEELAQYAYVASHDLQEPLRKIRTFSDILRNQQGHSPQSTATIEKINQSAERMSTLIHDLLVYSRLLNADDMVRPVDLGMIIQAVSNDFELLKQEKQAVIIIGDMPVIHAVALQMNQLFFNLVGNALKFSKTDELPVITIHSEPMDHASVIRYIAHPLVNSRYHHITVTDNGVGFEEKHTEQIFQIFKRLHGKGMYEGSGIGLALCRRIVNNHNGVLFAKSEPGLGSTFHIVIPEKQER